MISGSLWNFYREEIDGVDNYASDGDSFEQQKKNHKDQHDLEIKEMQIDYHNHQCQL